MDDERQRKRNARQIRRQNRRIDNAANSVSRTFQSIDKLLLKLNLQKYHISTNGTRWTTEDDEENKIQNESMQCSIL